MSRDYQTDFFFCSGHPSSGIVMDATVIPIGSWVQGSKLTWPTAKSQRCRLPCKRKTGAEAMLVLVSQGNAPLWVPSTLALFLVSLSGAAGSTEWGPQNQAFTGGLHSEIDYVVCGENLRRSIDTKNMFISFSSLLRPPVGGIAGTAKNGAVSIVLAAGYPEDKDEGLTFTYTGAGGRDLKEGNKRVGHQTKDQELTGSNEALARTCDCPFNPNGGQARDWRKSRPVRVVRSSKLMKHNPAFAPEQGNRYDGVYKLVKVLLFLRSFDVDNIDPSRLQHIFTTSSMASSTGKSKECRDLLCGGT